MPCPHKHSRIITSYQRNKIAECFDCGLVFNRDPHFSDYREYYQENNSSRFNSLAERLVKMFRFGRAVKIKLLAPRAKKILDVGCGRGYMLYFLKNYLNFKTAVGTQISRPARLFCQQKLGIDVWAENFPDINFPQKFDIITMYHVLEHLADPELSILSAWRNLEPGGHLILELPNFDSWTNRITRDYWLALDPEHHLFFFTRSSLFSMLEKNGFKIKKFDSFSWEYSIFTSAQSLVNVISHSENIFFQQLRGQNQGGKLYLHVCLFILLVPIVMAVNLALYFSSRGENLNVVAIKIG